MLFRSGLTGKSTSRFGAEFTKRFIQSPGLFLFYVFWITCLLCQSLRSGWSISRTYRRLKKGLPMDHAPRLSRRLVSRTMLVLAVATSIDALAVGVTFAFLRVDIVPAVALIGVCTFVISAAGVKVGNVFGTRYKSKAELFGGAVLVLIGLRLLLEHLELLPF